MTDPMQQAVEVLARALPRATMDASREASRAILAEITPLICATPPDVAELVEALRGIIARWDTPAWKDAEPTGAVIDRARAVLAKWEGQ